MVKVYITQMLIFFFFFEITETLIPMQKLVAATSIAIFILSLYPVLLIASLTRSSPSLKLKDKKKKGILSNRELKETNTKTFTNKFSVFSFGLYFEAGEGKE